MGSKGLEQVLPVRTPTMLMSALSLGPHFPQLAFDLLGVIGVNVFQAREQSLLVVRVVRVSRLAVAHKQPVPMSGGIFGQGDGKVDGLVEAFRGRPLWRGLTSEVCRCRPIRR